AALGVVESHRFASTALGREARYLAWLPRDAAGKKLPLLVLLHGSNASPDDVSDAAHDLLARLAEKHGLAIVCPAAGPARWSLDAGDERVATFVADELLADVAAHLPVGDRRGIAGLSMGGHGAVVLALTRPGFAAASSISGVVDLTEASD